MDSLNLFTSCSFEMLSLNICASAAFTSEAFVCVFTGILHNRLGRVIVKEAGFRGNTPIADLEDHQLLELISTASAFTVTLTEPLGMDAAQVTAGGIETREFDPATMESKLVPSLYACGEVLDVDGDCGGYNLQWAWSSGRLAGFSAGKEET